MTKRFTRHSKKDDLFTDLMEGIAALADARKGKRKLRTHAVSFKPVAPLKPADVVQVRTRLHLTRKQFAVFLRTNPRTLENWEQGRAKPNAQAVLLIRLVSKYPDTVKRLASV
jgi:putative transcriptional regulator